MHPGASGIGALASGTRFGSYEIVKQIGGGGMGTVYEAVHVGLGKRVALKTLHPGLTTDPECVERFVREGRASARLRHPNVVDVTDVGVHDRVPYLVMELLEGSSLADILDREGRVSPERALEMLLPVASTLAAAHAEGVLHRDLKPDNVFIARTPVGPAVPKLLDFGISKVAGESTGVTGSGDILGTPYYMSPEQTRGVRYVTPKSDQYSLAVVLYECLTGARPFEGGGVIQVLAAINAKPIATLRSHVSTIPPGLESTILRALSRDPDARFESVKAFAAALLEHASESTQRQWEPVFDPNATIVDRISIDPREPTSGPGATVSPIEPDLAGTTTPDAPRARSSAQTIAGATLVAALVIVALGGGAYALWHLTRGRTDVATAPLSTSESRTRPAIGPSAAPPPPTAPDAPIPQQPPVAPAIPSAPPVTAITPPANAVPSAEPATKQRRSTRAVITRRDPTPPPTAPNGPRIGRNGAPIVR